MVIKRTPHPGKIGVLMGGPSSEREISLKSGRAVLDNLKKAGYQAQAIDILSEDIKENIRLIKSHNIDCAFIALHGRFGEDGKIQGLLDSIDIPYTGSGSRASSLAMDKSASRSIFAAEGLKVPRHKLIDKKKFRRDMIKSIELPAVVKPVAQGSSIGLYLVDSRQELEDAVRAAFKFDARILIEEYIKGREVTVSILEEQALPVIEIIPAHKFFDYEAKYKPGLTRYDVPAKITGRASRLIKAAALKAHKLLGCFGCSRVDMISSGKEIFILEVNTIPGMTETSLLPKAAACAGITFPGLCEKLITLAYAKKKV